MQNLTILNRAYWLIVTQFVYKWHFRNLGKCTKILKPLRLEETKSIILEDHVFISYGAWIIGNKNKNNTLLISSGTVIGNYSHIVAKQSIKIEENVLIADKVFITDCTHAYEDISEPILNQPIKEIGNVIIGEGSWIGENACILGAKVGKHCIIGANTVIKKDIPDFCVAVGNPARIIKKYDFQSSSWTVVDR